MYQNILSTIICYTFEDYIGAWQAKEEQDGLPMHGMVINFSLNEVDWSAPPRYPKVQLLIFGYGNYIGVYYRESESRENYGEWQHLSHHDSCWRSDGVDTFLRMFEKNINSLGWHDGICNNKWYSKMEITPGLVEELRQVTNKYHYPGK